MSKTNFVACIVLILVIKLNAQKKFLETQYAINDLHFCSKNGEIVYANDTTLYFVDYKTLKIKDSIALINNKTKFISSFQYLDTPQPLIIIKTKTKQKYYQNYFEYPEDSTYFFSRTQNKIINKFSGNIYASFNEENPSIAVVGYNEYNDYKDDYGNVNKSPLIGKLESFPNRVVVESSGTIRKIQVSNSGTRVAIIYQKYFGKGDPYDHILEIRDLPSLDIVTSKKIKDKTISISFSSNDEHVVLKKDANSTYTDFSLSEEEYFKIYFTSTLEEVSEIPKDLKVKEAVRNGTVWKRIKTEVINVDFNSKQRIHKIWPNLTPFSIIDGFKVIDDEIILLYGNMGYGYSGEKNGIIKYGLKNEAVFSEIKNVSERDTLYNPLDVRIMDNKTSVYGVTYNSKSNLLLIKDQPSYELSGFQIWSALDKKKFYDVEFPKKVNPFMDNEGETCLIFEEYEGTGFREFKMKVLDIKTGIAKVKLFEDSEFDGLSAKCHNLRSKSNEWICSDGRSKFWRVDIKDFTIQLLNDLSNDKYYRADVESFRPIPDSDKVLIALNSVNVAPNHSVTESHFEGYKIFNPNNLLVQDLPALNKATDVFPLNKNKIVFKNGTSLKLYDVTTNNVTPITKIADNNRIADVLLLDNKAEIVMDKKDSLVDSLQILSYDYGTKKVIANYKIPSSKGLFKNFEGLNYYSYDSYYTYNHKLRAKVEWNSQKPKYTQSHDLNINSDGKLLYRDEWLINLKDLEVEQQLLSYTKNTLLENDEIVLLNTDKYGAKDYKFRIVNTKNTDSILWKSKTVRMDFGDRPSSRVWTKDKNFVLFYNSFQTTDSQTIYLLDVKNRELNSKKINFKIKKACFAEDARQVVLTSHSDIMQKNSNSVFYSIEGLKKIREINTDYDDEVDSNNYIFTDFEFLLHYSLVDDKIEKEKSYYARRRLRTSKYLKEKNLLVAGTDKGSLVFWNIDNSSPKHIEKVSDSEIIKIVEVNNSLYVLSKDSEISVVNLDNLSLEVSCKIFENDKQIRIAWLTPEGYFKANKSDIRNFHFVKNGKAFPLIDYEIYLNRPDIIMQKLGFTSSKSYELYKNAYLKRLTRNGYDENTDIFNLDRPKLKLRNRAQIPILSEQKQLNLAIENTSNAEELIVYINGVPTNKEVVKDKHKLNTLIELNSGINRISILTKNESGKESEPVSFEVTSTAPRTESKLYYIGIGVSKYQDSTMNLRYADKDVERISKVLTSKYENRSYIKTLLNEGVNKTSVSELKTILQSTDIDDTVIVSFSGHGLIGKDKDFYFASYDIDFNNPEEKGISYTDIQSLLTDIPARRKLLLIDACHSGELDTTNDKMTPETKVVKHVPKGAKGSKAKNKTAKNEESFKLMQTLFYDIDRGNGSYVISAAGGSEFAYENEKWKNGVFTYSFINALYELSYDTWKGEQGIRISKLKDYVYKSVVELTNNQQRPTSRAENLEWDWVLE
ncbi:caspase family protein [Flavivirga rizhaonensis]|uniref:Caspase family protein n=1 Tax=Flavivirga rizhaonensis TaxID=2559571 RepID=A0A4S1E2G3_9FLAO|nr:caspase family protein [Flavivirga rizhaonensis]TGV04836.1 caspase family protein [Flavivirga rizhaonensis]